MRRLCAMTPCNGRCGRLPFCGHYLQCCCRVVGRVLPCCTAMFLLRACHVTAAMPLRRSRTFGNGMSSPLPATMVCPSRPTCVAMSKLRDLFDRRSVLQNSSIHRATIRDAKLLSCTSQAGLRLGARPCVAAKVLLLPCYCHVIAMLLPCYCRVCRVVMSTP